METDNEYKETVSLENTAMNTNTAPNFMAEHHTATVVFRPLLVFPLYKIIERLVYTDVHWLQLRRHAFGNKNKVGAFLRTTIAV